RRLVHGGAVLRRDRRPSRQPLRAPRARRTRLLLARGPHPRRLSRASVSPRRRLGRDATAPDSRWRRTSTTTPAASHSPMSASSPASPRLSIRSSPAAISSSLRPAGRRVNPESRCERPHVVGGAVSRRRLLLPRQPVLHQPARDRIAARQAKYLVLW